MNKLTLSATILAASVVFSNPADARDYGRHDFGDKEMYEKIKNMTEEERTTFHEERKAKWESMSKEEKLKVINEKRDERRKRMDEEWNSMSDDEKIKFVEEKMGSRYDKKSYRKGKKDSD